MKKMKRFSIFLLLGVLIFSLFFSACGTEIPHNENPNAYQPTQDAYEDNMVNVCIKPEYSEVNKPWYAEDFNLKGIKIEKIVDRKYREDPSAYPPVSSNWSQVLELTLSKHSKKNVINAIHQIEVLDFVEWAIPEYIYSHSDTYVPNDTNYSLQWGLNNIDGASIENVWNFTMGDASPRIKVGIFENNVQSNHPDLRVINGPYTPTNSVPAEHGTHVAGIIGAIANNNLGISGVAQVEIVLLNRNNFVGSIDWAINNNVKIINASFYYHEENNPTVPAPPNSKHVDALKDFSEAGGLFIGAAGNSTNNTDTTPQYPGGYADKRNYPDLDNVISVGALDQNGTRSSFSNYGENSVNIYAPGRNILSTMPNSGYGYMSGTSMAAPHVTGVASLLLSYNPNLTAAHLKSAIINGADTIQIEVPDGEDEDTLPDTQWVKKLNASKTLKYTIDNSIERTLFHHGIQPFTQTIDSNSNSFLESNLMLKLEVSVAYDYEFSFSSTSPLEIALYDEDLNIVSISTTELNGGCQIDLEKSLSVGEYYLRAYYTNESATGTITATLNNGSLTPHQYNYEYVNDPASGQHYAKCECGAGILRAHSVRASDPPSRRRCLLCGAFVAPTDESFIIMGQQAQYVTLNGSFIAPDGVIYLMDEDIEAFLNGTLVFYKKTDLPLESA